MMMRKILFTILLVVVTLTRTDAFISKLIRKIKGERYKASEMCELLMAFENAAAPSAAIKYEKYCGAISSLSGKERDKKIDLQCQVVSITASKIMPLIEYDTTKLCVTFEQR